MSPRKGSDFAGLSVAIVTPFSGDEVDYVRLREQIEFQIDAGTRCLVPVGTTGESPTLSHDEHEKVIAEVIQCVAGRAKVMAGTGSNSTAEALRLTKRAAAEGADATLQVAPYYNKPTQEGFYQHFRAVAEAVDIPVCVYNIPGRTGKEIDVETIQRLSDVSGITMVKEATGKLDQCSAIVGSTDLTVLSGDDSTDVAHDERWRRRRDLGSREFSSDGYDSISAICNSGRLRGRARATSSTVHALPKHARLGNQSDPCQSRNAAGRSRLGRTTTTHDAARRIVS